MERPHLYFLEEENADLRRRVAFLCRESPRKAKSASPLEQTRAKIPATAFRTS